MYLKLITLNLRYDKPDSGNNAWTVRRNAIADMINHYTPDIIGTQEGFAHQLLDLHRLIPNYQSVGCDRTGTGKDEHCAIFYHTQRLKCIDKGDFFLSNTPQIPGSISLNWGNPLPRMVSWAVFTLAGQSKTITCLNTHLDYKSAKARELGVELIRDRINQFSPENTYLFLTGDFNTEPGTLPRQQLSVPLANGISLNDALAGLELGQQLSFHDFTGQAFAAVDTIYYDSRISLPAVQVDNTQWQGILPSDHFPVIAEFLSPSEL